jgi:N-methylhydantoinase A
MATAAGVLPLAPSYCIGVDVGGTFTDVVLSDGTHVWRAKAPSTHGHIGDGVIHGCELVASQAGLTLKNLLPSVERFGLGTTAVTNVIASRVGRRVGLITTAGFEDLVPIARVRRVPKDGWLVPPDTLVEREQIRGVLERVDRNGTVLQALDPETAVAAARDLVERENVEGIAVSFLWACVNPIHEAAAVLAIAAALPGLHVVSAAELLPVVREYERTTFALLNVYTASALDGVDLLVERLASLGLPNAPLLVHSGGGSISVKEGRSTPALLAESGPAAGVVGALAVCEAAGITNAVACDMGGTSFDMSIIRAGAATRRTRGELMGIWTALPMVDIESASAGGGSIGWADGMGLLRVGPRSAGAYPGPACYGRGGTQPTVTDALLVLGYLDPDRFLGGAMALDRDAARLACETLGKQIGTDTLRTAWGIREIALAEMTRSLRAEFARKGLDARSFAIVSLGGCGGLFNGEIAKGLGIRKMLAPELTSVLSAFGAATADIRRERTQALSLVIPGEPETLSRVAEALGRRIDADLDADGVAPDRRSIRYELDLRFMRQQWELTMPADDGFSATSQAAIADRFTDEYASRYGRGALMMGAPVELVALRVIGTGATTKPELTKREASEARETIAIGTREIYVDAAGTMIGRQVPQYDGDALAPGGEVAGPAIIDAPDTTIWVPEGCIARVDRHATLAIEILA